MNVLQNFTHNPCDTLESVFEHINTHQMADLPFNNKKLTVKAVGFSLYENDWLGVLLTPWMLSILLIPGPNRVWQAQTVGNKVGLCLPAGNFSFTYGSNKQLGTYLACSVMSPLQNITSQVSALQLAKDVRQLITAIPTEQIQVKDQSRRALFGLQNKATS